MSQENVEIVRATIEAFNREDWDAVLEHGAAGLRAGHVAFDRPQRGMYSLDQLRSFLEDFTETFESFRIEAEFIEAGEHVVVPNTGHARGRDGIEAEASTAFVYTLRDGAIERVSMYQEREQAHEAAGLEE